MTDQHNTNEPRALLTVKQTAERLSIGRTSVFALLKNGHLQSVRIGRLRRIPAESIDTYVTHLTQQQ